MAKRIDEYSVWNPPTSSCSASTRSKGGRFISAVAAMKNTTNGTTPVAMTFQFRMPSWADDDAVGGQGAADDEHGGDREAEGRLVAHHLGRGPHRPEQRVLRPRRPAGQHHAVDGDGAHGQHEQDADRRVGHLEQRVVPEDADHAVVAVGEVAAHRDDGEDHEHRHHGEVGRQEEHEAVGALGEDVLLEDQLDAVGQRLQDAPRARPCSARCGSACRRSPCARTRS